MFKLWSDNNLKAKETLKPDLGVRSWDQISKREKEVVWCHFINKGWFGINNNTYNAVKSLNEANKARAFCEHLLQHGMPHTYGSQNFTLRECCLEAAGLDFNHIFHNEHQDVVYELLSYYIVTLNMNEYDKEKLYFKNLFNDISNQFGLNILMIETSFVPRQGEKIIKEIYEPVLSYLLDEKWKEANRILVDAFNEYRKNTPQGYSNCVTNTVSAIQAFLQTLVNEKTGKGNISQLITEAQKISLIPNDFFTQKIFDNIESIFAKERQETGIAHPKKEYANEKNARTILNLAMVFIQHCIQK